MCLCLQFTRFRIELIGEEIYDEFDSEGQSRLSHYVSQPKCKGSSHESPAIPSEAAPVSTTTGPRSQQAVSPTLSFSSDPTPTKTASLRTSLNALVSQKKACAVDSGHHQTGKNSSGQKDGSRPETNSEQGSGVTGSNRECTTKDVVVMQGIDRIY